MDVGARERQTAGAVGAGPLGVPEHVLVERAARAMFEQRAAHAGMRFDALPAWAQWVRERYLDDARAALEAVGLIAGAPVGDRYERLASAAFAAEPVAVSPCGSTRRDDTWPTLDRVPRERAGFVLDDQSPVLSDHDVRELGMRAVSISLDWVPDPRTS